ncbi:hypothetical protein [Pedobacter sp. R20-19]|uniref:hypothetical protein n=1 Tax=Pedobacter sp. R20-19 TaxID=1270196 RepID=UPI000B2525BC|nr:hypothetical protein [Pedobacter sp. R20-19]
MLSLNTKKSDAQISGNGCDFGGRIAIQYLGSATYYGNSNDVVEVYSTSSAVPINKGNGKGYDCDAINDYDAFQVWDPSIQPYGANRTVPASHDIRRNPSSRQHECVVASSRYATPDGEGTIVGYTYKDPNNCTSARPNNLPLDDYLPFLVLMSVMISLPFIIKNSIFI